MESRSYEVQGSDGLALRVLEWGSETASPVVMLHGIRGYARTFAGLAAALLPRFRTIAYDQRGRGESDWDPACQYYTDAYIRDLEAIVREIGLKRFDLLGHSMGGIDAMVYAAANSHRVRRLVIEDAGPGAFEDSAGATRIRRELMSTPASFESWDAAVEFIRQLRPSVSATAREARLRNMLKQEESGNWTWRYDHAGIARIRLNPDPARIVPLWPCVDAIACPTLVLRGSRSDYLARETAEAMAARNPNLRCHEVADAGHSVHDDQPESVALCVDSFLSERDSQTP